MRGIFCAREECDAPHLEFDRALRHEEVVRGPSEREWKGRDCERCVAAEGDLYKMDERGRAPGGLVG